MNQLERGLGRLAQTVIAANKHYQELYTGYSKEQLPRFNGLPSRVLLEAWLSADPDNFKHAKERGLIAPFTKFYCWVSVHDDWMDNPNGPIKQSKSQLVKEGKIDPETLRSLTRAASFQGHDFSRLNSDLVREVCSTVNNRESARAILVRINHLRNNFFRWTADADIAEAPINLERALGLRTGLAYGAAYSAISILEASKPKPDMSVPENIANWAAAMQVADDVIDFTDDVREGQTTLVDSNLTRFDEWDKIQSWYQRYKVIPLIMLQHLAPKTTSFLQQTFHDYLNKVEKDYMAPFKTAAALYFYIGGNLTPIRNVFRSKYNLESA